MEFYRADFSTDNARDNSRPSEQGTMTDIDEQLTELRQKTAQLLQKKNWDGLISYLSELIGHESRNFKPEMMSECYHLLGLAYGNKEDHDLASKKFSIAIALNSNNSLAYHSRGVSRSSVGSSEVARGDYGAARGNYKAATADFEKAIKLDPKDALAYQNCAFAYRHLDQHEKATRLSSKAIELEPTCASAYKERGSAYLHEGRYGQAFGDFDRANKYDPESTMLSAGMYIVSRITSIYGTEEESQREKAFEFFYKLADAIRIVQEKLFYEPENVQEIAHYTTLYALRSLAKQSPFRLSNGAYMNDPEEGRTFFEIMEDVHDTNAKDSFYKKNPPYPSPAYIGSFAKVTSGEAESKDKLFLWRTYGKHDVEEAAGACLIFKHNGQNFAETCPPTMGYMPQPTMDDASQQISKPALYRVVYRNDEGRMSEKISEELSQLSESLKQIEAHVLQRANDKEEQLRSLVCELLDSIRFLFKKDHYKEEQEVRIIDARRAEDDETWKSNGVRVDTERIPPRFYLEAGNLHFSEVILGPQARGIREWTLWLKEQDEELTVKKSGIEYGERHP